MTADFKQKSFNIDLKYTTLNLTEGYSLEQFWHKSTILISKSAKYRNLQNFETDIQS